jgi:hypothetical protein
VISVTAAPSFPSREKPPSLAPRAVNGFLNCGAAVE